MLSLPTQVNKGHVTARLGAANICIYRNICLKN